MLEVSGPKFDHKVPLTSQCVCGSDKGRSKASDGNWGLGCKLVEIGGEQQTSGVRFP